MSLQQTQNMKRSKLIFTQIWNEDVQKKKKKKTGSETSLIAPP